MIADDAFGRDTVEGKKWFGEHRRILLDLAGGLGRTIDAIRQFDRTDRAGKILRRQLEFFRRNRARMACRVQGMPVARSVRQARSSRSGYWCSKG